MIPNIFSNSAIPVGQAELHVLLGGGLPPPAVQSFVHAGARRTRETESGVEEYYTPQYATDRSLLENLRFALKNEALDLRIIHAALLAAGKNALEEWIRAEPVGGFSRRAWFLYETLTGETLDIEAVQAGNYVDALDAKRHYVAAPRKSPRHRVRDNLLGNREMCPTLRRTAKLEAMVNLRLNEEASALVTQYTPETLDRAVNFLYTKETRSSFALESEVPSSQREERFLQALQAAVTFSPNDKSALIALQGNIVDPRYAAQDWRSIQNFVGETTRRYGESVHFICPRPQDVPLLMQGWAAMTTRLLADPLDAVLAAALSAFAFVFIHPFEDGNGRLHRFLIHSTLAKRGFTPPDMIFPVSVAILRQRHLYDRALEAFSAPLMPAIKWDFTPESEIIVHNDTRDLYRFFDATSQAEYLYDRVAETIREDFKAELDFLTDFDAAFAAVQRIIDMPDRKITLLVRCCLQNGGRLSHNKRKQFLEVTDDEIQQIEAAMQNLTR